MLEPSTERERLFSTFASFGANTQQLSSNTVMSVTTQTTEWHFKLL